MHLVDGVLGVRHGVVLNNVVQGDGAASGAAESCRLNRGVLLKRGAETLLTTITGVSKDFVSSRIAVSLAYLFSRLSLK